MERRKFIESSSDEYYKSEDDFWSSGDDDRAKSSKKTKTSSNNTPEAFKRIQKTSTQAKNDAKKLRTALINEVYHRQNVDEKFLMMKSKTRRHLTRLRDENEQLRRDILKLRTENERLTSRECTVCANEMSHPSVLIPCYHVFCSNCAKQLENCPICTRLITQTPRIYIP